jgi:hypothetical protein
MEQVLSAKLKLTPTTEQKNWLRAVSLAYRDALNYAARVAEFLMSRLEATLARYAKSACSASVNANDLAKVAQGTKLQKLVRYSIYPIYGLPAQIAFDTTTAFGAWESQANSAFGHFRSYKAFLGLSTHGENYGFEQHADIVGDLPISKRVVLTWQDSSRTGCILAIADVSSVDSKTDSKRQLFRAEVGHRLEAERLRRPTIPVLKEVGQDS